MDVAELFQRVHEKYLQFTERSWIQAQQSVSIAPGFVDLPILQSSEKAPERLSQSLNEVTAQIRNGEWHLFGWKPVEVGIPPKWQLEGFTGKLVEVGKCTNHRTLPDGADTRVVWEINRWAELVQLCMHGHVNQDPSALILAQDWLEDWLQHHPMGQELPWKSALEVAIRLTNFAWLDALVMKQSSPEALEIQKRQQSLRVAVLLPHAAWIQRYLSFGSSANNHRLGELVGLFVAVQRWPQLKNVLHLDAAWLQQEIRKCLLAQFQRDGGNREQALHYQLFAMEMFWQTVAFGAIWDEEVRSLMKDAKQFFVEATHSEEPWEYGDNDDAQLVPVCAQREEGIGEWMGWILGREKGESIQYWLGDSEDLVDLRKGWQVKTDSGMAFYRDETFQLRLDASPLGYGKMAAHGHLDALHLSLWSKHDAIVVDPGTGGYFGATELRTSLASWEYHNGPLPSGGYRTPKRFGTFLWGKAHPLPTLETHFEKVKATMGHEGHSFSRQLSVRPEEGSFEVYDVASANAPFEEHWIFAPGVSVTPMEAPSELRFRVQSRTSLWELRVLSPEQSATVTLSEIEVSPRFGKIEKTALMKVQSRDWLKLHWTLLTLGN